MCQPDASFSAGEDFRTIIYVATKNATVVRYLVKCISGTHCAGYELLAHLYPDTRWQGQLHYRHS